MRRKVWIHRGLAGFFLALTIPAVLWWRDSVLFVILLSLATQISTEISCAEAADDRTTSDRLDRIEALLTPDGDPRGRARGTPVRGRLAGLSRVKETRRRGLRPRSSRRQPANPLDANPTIP